MQECCDDGPMEVGECFWEERRHAQKEPRLGERGIRLEGGEYSEQKEARVQHIMLEFDAHRHDVDEQMDREYHQEEWPEMVKHFGKEVPPEPGVGCEVR